jgi:hypothetical protein
MVCLHMISYVDCVTVDILFRMSTKISYIGYDVVRQYTMLYDIVRLFLSQIQRTAQRLQIFPRPPPKAWAYGLVFTTSCTLFLGLVTSAAG